jgi:acyl carrier protein
VTTENEVKRYVARTFASDLTADDLPSDVDLMETGIVDSLGLLRLIAWVGEHFDIPVDDQDISPDQFASVSAITAFIHGARDAA